MGFVEPPKFGNAYPFISLSSSAFVASQTGFFVVRSKFLTSLKPSVCRSQKEVWESFLKIINIIQALKAFYVIF